MKQDDLYDLIQSLSSAEKRYFRIFAQRHAKGASTLQLYDAMLGLEVYSEDELRQVLKGAAMLRQLPVAKNYLKDIVLQALRSFHRGSSVSGTLREMLDRIELLSGRGQQGALKKLVRRAWKKAWQFQRPLVLMELMQWRLRLARRSLGKDSEEKIRELISVQQEVAREIQTESELRLMHDELFVLVQTVGPQADGKVPERVLEILAHPWVLSGADRFFDSELVRQQIWVWGGLLKGDFVSAELAYWALLKHWEAHPHQIKERLDVYLTGLCSHLDLCLLVKELRHYSESMDRLKSLKARNHAEESRLFFWRYHLELRYLLQEEHFEKAFLLTVEIGAGLAGKSSPWGAAGDLTFFHNIAGVCFMNSRFKEALPWVNQVLYHPKVDVRKDLQRAARMFLLIIHWERGNYDVLENILRGQKRALKKKEEQKDFELVLHSGMANLLRDSNPHQQVPQFRNMFEAMEAEAGEPGFEAMRVWLESKLVD